MQIPSSTSQPTTSTTTTTTPTTTTMSTPTPNPPATLSLLIINPNTTTAMTEALIPAITSLHPTTTTFTYFTCPSTPSNPGIPSINSPTDASLSATASLPHLLPFLPSHDGFLVACYSAHPLVQQLQAETDKLEALDGRRRFVTGIFDASVAVSLSLASAMGADGAFGIVSTGKVWEGALREAVEGFVGVKGTVRFVGCETTGLDADQLHRLPAEEVRGRMKGATGRLVGNARREGRVLRAVCLGCAGMVGLEVAVREALVEEMGEEGRRVRVVDGVKAGVGELVLMARGGF